MLRLIVVSICFALLVVMTSCGGSSGSGGAGGGDDNTSPAAQITTPADGSTFTLGDVIQFAGSCSDSEDGDLNGASLVWTSDVDGQIGTGETCDSSALSAGAHQITLTATDSNGALGIDTVVVLIPSLPDTGQTTSYTDTFGEDSDYFINPPSFTKLDSDGNNLEADAINWVMVRDDVTGLIWEIKTDDGGINDKDDTYSWQDAQNIFIVQLNSVNFGGYSDWRLPTIKELFTIVDWNTLDPAINTEFFPNTQYATFLGHSYWSSTSWAPSVNTDAWYIWFGNGQLSSNMKADRLHVRAVRGG